MNDDALLIQIQADTAGFKTSLKQLGEEAKKLAKQFDKVDIGGSATEAIRKVKKVGNARIAQGQAVYTKQQYLDNQLHTKKMANIKKEAAAQKQAANGARGHSIGRAISTTALYGAAAQALFGLQKALKAIGTEFLHTNDRIYQNMAVLQKSRKEAIALTDAVVDIGVLYGGSMDEIQEAMITLGRAGVDTTEVLTSATKVMRELALITGDDMREGAEVMSSFAAVFDINTAKGFKEVGNQIAYIANETRLGTKDFSTISNYALSAAKSIGLTKEAYLALNGAMSKAGKNASTIGTSIRRFNKIIHDDSAANVRMFKILGTTQKEFADAMQRDSNKALIDFAKHLSSIDSSRYSKAVADMDTLTRDLLDALRSGAIDFETFLKGLTGASSGMGELSDQAEKMSEGVSISIQKIVNKIISMGHNLATTSVTMDSIWKRMVKDAKPFIDVLNLAGSLIRGLVGAGNQIGRIAYATADIAKLKAAKKELQEEADGYFVGGDRKKQIKNTIDNLNHQISLREKSLVVAKKEAIIADKKAVADKKSAEAAKKPFAILGKGLKFGKDSSQDASKKQLEYERQIAVVKKQINGEDIKRSSLLKVELTSLKAKEKTMLNTASFSSDNEATAKVQLDIAKKQLALKKALTSENKSSGGSGGGGGGGGRLQDKLSRDAVALLEAKMRLEQAIVDMNDAKNSKLYTQVQLDMKALKVAKEKLAIAKKYKAAAIKEGLPKGDLGEKKLIDLKIKVVKAQENVNKKSVAAWNRVIKDLKAAGKSAFDQLMKLDFKGALETLTGGFLDSMLKPMKDYFSTTFAGLFKQDGAIGSMFSGMFGSGKKGGILDSIGGVGAVVSAVVGVAGSLFGNKAARDLEKAQKRATENATANSKTIENSLNDLEEIGTLGLKHSGKMVGSLQTIADMTLISAKNMGAELSGTGYTETSKSGFFNDSTTKLMESGLSLDAATIAQINNGQMTATKYMIEVTENSGFLGIGASTDTKRTDMGSANGAIMEPITEAYRQGVEVIRSASSALGVSAAEFAATSAIWETSIQDLNFKGMDAAQRAQLIQGAIAGDMDRWAESLVSLQPILEKFSHDGEAAGEALIRIVTTYEVAEKAMRDMGDTLAPLTEGGYEVADAMIKAAGGMTKFAKGVKDFQEAFMTDGQKQAVLQRDLAISSAQIGLSLPQTAQGMLALHNNLMRLAATSPVAAEQLRWLNANVADLAQMVEYAGSKAGAAAGKIGGCGSALGSCGTSASSCGAAIDDLASSLDFISAQAEFHARKLALSDDDKASAEYAVKSSKAMLLALKAEHDLSNLTIDNFEQQLAAAFKLGNMTDDMLANYTSIGSAILDVAEAEKELQDLRKEAEAEKVKAKLDKVNAEVAFYEDIFKKITGAFTGNLNPYNSREKAAQQHAFSDAYHDAGTTNEQAYFDSLYKGLEYEKKMSVTKEAYAILFDEYLNDLKNVEYVEQEKTTNDVVKELEEANKKLDDLTDAIEKASYK